MLEQLKFNQLEGWQDDNHDDTFKAFLKSSLQFERKIPKSGKFGISAKFLNPICQAALTCGILSKNEAKEFFERHFNPILVNGPNCGFVTGYFEPVVYGSRVQTNEFNTPLYRTPTNLTMETPRDDPLNLDEKIAQTGGSSNEITDLPDRKAIDDGALVGLGLELVYVKSPVEAFFIHLQGSATIKLVEGGEMRIRFSAKNGHPYTPIGRILINDGHIAKSDMTADRLRDWLENNPLGPKYMARNRSYIFFEEIKNLQVFDGPVGAASVSLTGGRSLAIDQQIHTFGTPVWINANLQDVDHGFTSVNKKVDFGRLLIAQDTGSAILGPSRGDIFVGTGNQAGKIAGRIKHPATFIVFAPKEFSV